MHCQNKKTYNMLDKKKYRLVTTANKVSVVTAYDSLKDAKSYEDEFIDFCCLHILDFQVRCSLLILVMSMFCVMNILTNLNLVR